jgi:hypothetical protein
VYCGLATSSAAVAGSVALAAVNANTDASTHSRLDVKTIILPPVALRLGEIV